MTSLLAAPRSSTTSERTLAPLLAVAVGAGVALGALDLLLQVTLPYPYANLANSSAVWALAAFALALWAGTTPARAALGGTVLLVVAVQAYYLVAIAVDMADAYTLTSPSTMAWMVFGVLAGVVFGVAGTWARGSRPWLAAAGVAAMSAVFWAETTVGLWGGSSLDDLGTTLLKAAAAVGVLLAFVARPGLVLRALLLVAPLTALAVVGFRIGGF